MKAVILAGGFGTRLSEETDRIPKPLVEIGGKPILWHIMKIYSRYGINDFIICLGYKGYLIKEYFAHYHLHTSDITVDVTSGNIEIHRTASEAWRVTLVDTGIDTMTGGRILRAKNFVGNEPFMLTYGDGVADIDLHSLLKFHQSHGKALTMTSVQPEGRFGAVDSDANGLIETFYEKPRGDGAWINGGFFVCQPEVFNYITDGDKSVFERTPLENLAKDRQLYAYRHHGFWKCMDTLRDKLYLNQLWENHRAEWKIWE